MSHILSGDQKYHISANILGVAANPLKGAQRQYDIDELADTARIFHQESR